jgi:hypothetical protein
MNAIAACTVWMAVFSSLASPATYTAFVPIALISSTKLFSRSSLPGCYYELGAFSSKRLADASPMPALAPVTIATFPS